MTNDKTVYVIGSDAGIGVALKALTGRYNISVMLFPDVDEFLRACETHRHGLAYVITDAEPSGAGGSSNAGKLRATGVTAPVIEIVDSFDTDVANRAHDIGVTEILDRKLIHAFLRERWAEVFPATSPPAELDSGHFELPNGTPVTFRVIGPRDVDLEQTFVRNLSNHAKHMRFFSSVRELRPDMLYRFTHPHFPQDYAIIATVYEGDNEREIGVARYVPTGAARTAEFAVVVADGWQGQGIATCLMRGLTAVAAIAGVLTLEGIVLKENRPMLGLAAQLGFEAKPVAGDPTVLNVSKVLRNA